ncbi:MAG: hypothetical protein ACOX3H_10655 [Saccharofermentanales bacterium]|jgi:UDP-3-O-[3-hydroxymyristoyl] glucosamine N-acyltransferase LpxD
MQEAIKAVSYIGEPQSNTAMFISAKAGNLLVNLKPVDNCLVFAENGLAVPSDLLEKHHFEFSDNPQLAYYHFTKKLEQTLNLFNSKRKIKVLANGARIGENVKLGLDVQIGTGAFIGHDCIIGDQVFIGNGAIIQKSLLADNVRIGENSVIGADGYNLVQDETGNLQSMPTLGKVEILSDTTVNSNCVVAAGLAGTTRIGKSSHLDSFCHVHHDCRIGNNVQLASSVIMGGFTEIQDGSFIGIGAKLKNRVSIGKHTVIGMGSIVLSDIPDHSKAYGVPAKVID